MKREIVAFGGYFKEFISTLTENELCKLDYLLTLLRTTDRLPAKFIKLIENGLYELRMEYNGNIYRVFFIFEVGRLVILFNGFQKKSQKTPKAEIDKALKIKKEYDGSKRTNMEL